MKCKIVRNSISMMKKLKILVWEENKKNESRRNKGKTCLPV